MSDSAEVIAFPSGRRTASRDEGDLVTGGPNGATADRTPRLREVIGEVLRDERREQDRTLADVAETASVSLPYLSEVERGVKEVSSDVLAAICDALDVPLVEIVQRTADRLRAGGTNMVMRAA